MSWLPKPPIKRKITDEEKLHDLLRKYHLIKNVLDELVDKNDKKTQKFLLYSLGTYKDKIIELAKKI